MGPPSYVQIGLGGLSYNPKESSFWRKDRHRFSSASYTHQMHRAPIGVFKAREFHTLHCFGVA